MGKTSSVECGYWFMEKYWRS